MPILQGIYAGLDVNARSGLFRLVKGKPERIEHAEWVLILDALGAEVGELLCVSLTREEEPKDGTVP